ncbi:hemerythrin domain-containing protein [Ginsengibacter hankyongi]|uniref:Hemerythrin domain-containing protein n=1 Tax=Ginsengibacter hankyongi TaxID=2607284 RepID=A0A5J5IEI8_9BACT|nr:hemerythrin domain-containing protein [Ginsengibacter hankyongi]KAA9038023.1 hemerythrin domain-containing protein [Ginsengibacter hankyongi]
METKPIKRSEHMLKLSKEHHSGLLFCWKIRQGLKRGVTTERIIKYTQYFWSHHLDEHFREEETILFSPLKDELVQRAIEHHKQIKHTLGALQGSSADDAKQKLAQLANLVDDHIRYEERKLFPHLEKTLSDEQLNKIGQQLAALQPSPSTDDFEDQFWVK